MGVSKVCVNDKDFVNAVRALMKLGYTQETIGEMLHQSTSTIGAVCAACGIKRKTKAENPEKKNREKIRKALKKAYSEGCTDKQMAARAQISNEKVKAWRIRNDLPENVTYTQCTAKSCKYHANECWKGSFEHGCDYAVITGKTRTAQLTKEEMQEYPCHLYEKGTRQRAKPEPLILSGSKPKREKSRFNWDYAEKLWREGKTDIEIAEEIGCSHSIVKMHRKEWGAANKQRKCYDWKRGKELWEQGQTNREIAEEIGANVTTVQKHTHEWRQENG